MKFMSVTFLIAVISASAFAQDKDVASDKFGNQLENRWGEPVYIDQISRKPIDKNGFSIKGQDIYNSGGIGKYNNEKPIYDSDGFKANRWGNK